MANKIHPIYSDCCQSVIVSRYHTRSIWLPYSDWMGKKDYCCKCKRPIKYALVGKFHWETMAVCELYDGKLYFFWQIVGTWDSVVEHQQEYVGQVKRHVDSITGRYNRDSDLIEGYKHKAFSDEYKNKVANPEWAL